MPRIHLNEELISDLQGPLLFSGSKTISIFFFGRFPLRPNLKYLLSRRKEFFGSYAQPHFKSCNMFVYNRIFFFLVQLVNQSGFDCTFTFTVNVLIFLSRILIRLQRKKSSEDIKENHRYCATKLK